MKMRQFNVKTNPARLMAIREVVEASQRAIVVAIEDRSFHSYQHDILKLALDYLEDFCNMFDELDSPRCPNAPYCVAECQPCKECGGVL